MKRIFFWYIHIFFETVVHEKERKKTKRVRESFNEL